MNAAAGVYPRPRGEYRLSPPPTAHRRGLPPPTRGIPRVFYQLQRLSRSTPAHAGNTRGEGDNAAATAVYPRPRGEYVFCPVPYTRMSGLPPPTRGIQSAAAHEPNHLGSTPAHAGNTATAALVVRSMMVYPRPRGEYLQRGRLALVSRGLPPPTRGILIGGALAAIILGRSTPAHAGNTGWHPAISRSTKVYPRPRGEYAITPSTDPRDYGLPPPTRGIPHEVQQLQAPSRSTPAHAGNTYSDTPHSAASGVYPRPRGEYREHPPLSMPPVGLPPPTRGIRAA